MVPEGSPFSSRSETGKLMVGEDGRFRVLDIGLSKLTDPSESLELKETKTVALAKSFSQTEEGTILGTASYMSPVQAERR